jgi:hypothetical protein
MNIRALLSLVIVCWAFLLCNPAPASAASNLDCIAASKGKKIRWNALWDSSRLDNDVQYRVMNVTQIDRIPLRRITLELHAEGSASLSNRTVIVQTEDKARAFCDRIVVEKDLLRFPGTETTDVSQLPFIHFTREGWVRGDPEPGTALGICLINSVRFSCPETDRQRFGSSLRTIEEELAAQVP